MKNESNGREQSRSFELVEDRRSGRSGQGQAGLRPDSPCWPQWPGPSGPWTDSPYQSWTSDRQPVPVERLRGLSGRRSDSPYRTRSDVLIRFHSAFHDLSGLIRHSYLWPRHAVEDDGYLSRSLLTLGGVTASEL